MNRKRCLLFLLLELLLWGELNGAAAIHLALGALEGTLTLQRGLTQTFSTSPALKKVSDTLAAKIVLQFETSILKPGLQDEDYKLKADGPYFRVDKVTLRSLSPKNGPTSEQRRKRQQQRSKLFLTVANVRSSLRCYTLLSQLDQQISSWGEGEMQTEHLRSVKVNLINLPYLQSQITLEVNQLQQRERERCILYIHDLGAPKLHRPQTFFCLVVDSSAAQCSLQKKWADVH